MPKIIENLPQRLLDEARRQIETSGYGAMTIRSVAHGCGVGVGTVYNYYPSKDDLVATFLLADWKKCMDTLTACASQSQSAEPVLRTMYDMLRRFLDDHNAIFRDEAAASAFPGSFSRYHSFLRSQLAATVRPFCRDDFMADFVTESMLVWTVAGKSFDEIFNLVNKLF